MTGTSDLTISPGLSGASKRTEPANVLSTISAQAQWTTALHAARAVDLPDDKSSDDPRLAGVKKNVEELVARTLIAPVLASLHNNPLKSDLFPETAAGKSLGPLLEAEVAKNMAASMGGSLVDHVARHLLNQLDRRAGATEGTVRRDEIGLER